MKNNYYEIVSDSMAPLIEVGDLVLIGSPKKIDVKVGSLVLFKDKGKKILHRVVKKTKSKIFLKGDNAFEFQEIKKSEVLGVGTEIFSENRGMKLGSVKEKIFVFLDKIFFQRVYFLKFFRYRVFRYKKMKKLKKILW